MLRFGFISEYDHQTGRARVQFAEDDIVSDWLPIAYAGAQTDKYLSPLASGEQVACLMDERLEYGVIVGATYNREDSPHEELAGDKIAGVVYQDGSYVLYDPDTGRYRREFSDGSSTTFEGGALAHEIGDALFRMNNNLFTIKNGQESLKGLLQELIQAMQQETHPTPAGPSGPPANAAAYQSVSTKLDSLLEE